MRLIDKFYCIQKEIFANGSERILYEGECSIKTELIRPEIRIKNFKYKEYFYLNENCFLKEELEIMSKIFYLPIAKSKRNPNRIMISNIHNDIRYSTAAICDYYENKENKDYLIIIYSKRWQFDYQPRGAAEDQLGEDVTYIHGIWENPELPESIIKKIKGEFYDEN